MHRLILKEFRTSRMYFFAGLLIVFSLSVLLPPFAVQDETHHFFRSVQISHTVLLA